MNAQTEWIAARKTGIGGSDIAAVLGLSPYKTPLQLWLEKTGRATAEPQSPDASERMHWGKVLEEVVARHYADTHGAKVQRINDMLRHPDVPIAIASIDRVVVTPGSRARWDSDAGRVLGADRVLEVKTAHAMAINSADWGNPGSDEVPQHYWLQVQWYLGITGLPFGDMAVLFGGQRYVEFTIAADRQIFADLLDEAAGWWRRHVEADVPPEPRSEDEAKSLWRSHIAGKEKIVDRHVADAVEKLAGVKAQIKALEEEEQRLRDIICAAFGDAETISYMGRKLATWKANKESARTDWRAVAAELSPPDELVAKHTIIQPGARVLRLNTKE